MYIGACVLRPFILPTCCVHDHIPSVLAFAFFFVGLALLLESVPLFFAYIVFVLHWEPISTLCVSTAGESVSPLLLIFPSAVLGSFPLVKVSDAVAAGKYPVKVSAAAGGRAAVAAAAAGDVAPPAGDVPAPPGGGDAPTPPLPPLCVRVQALPKAIPPPIMI